jgi:hypothetical protein
MRSVAPSYTYSSISLFSINRIHSELFKSIIINMKYLNLIKSYKPILISLFLTALILLVIDKNYVYPIVSDMVGTITPSPLFNLILIPFMLATFPLLFLFMYLSISLALILTTYSNFILYAMIRKSIIGANFSQSALISGSVFLFISTTFFYFSNAGVPHPIDMLYKASIALEFVIIIAEITNLTHCLFRRRFG